MGLPTVHRPTCVTYEANSFLASAKACSSSSNALADDALDPFVYAIFSMKLGKESGPGNKFAGKRQRGKLGPLYSDRRLPCRIVFRLKDHDFIHDLWRKSRSSPFSRCLHTGHPVMIRATRRGLSWKMIFTSKAPFA
jgi:hypothetical protein